MQWQEILTILLPILGLLAWVYGKLEKKLDKLDLTMQEINNRLTRLEGRFEERGYWESREYRKTGTDDKK